MEVRAVVADIPAPARTAIRSVTPVRHGTHRVMLAGLVVAAAAASVACSRADAPAVGTDPVVEADDVVSQIREPEAADPSVGAPPTGAPSTGGLPAGMASAPESLVPQPPAPPLELSSPEHQRYQRLRLETLRAMIEAAKLALPIGPFQERIDAAARIALEDVTEAGDRMEGIVADLQEAIAAAGR